MFKKIIVGGFALYGAASITDKLARAYFSENGRAIAEAAAMRFIEYLFCSYDVKDHEGRSLYFENRKDACVVLNELKTILKEDGYVTLADFYEAVDVDHKFQDTLVGWKNLDTAKVIRSRGRTYSIAMPRMKKLGNVVFGRN